MIVETPLSTKVVEEYDIAILSGMVMPVTIDAKAGDTFEELSDRLKIYLAPKPSMHDSKTMLPSESIVIYKAHIVSVNKRTREVAEMSPEERHQFAKTIQEMGGKVH